MYNDIIIKGGSKMTDSKLIEEQIKELRQLAEEDFTGKRILKQTVSE